MISIPRSDYLRRVIGCWLGKAIGGTLGMPYEGRLGPLNLSFYDPIPKEPAPNDDLDLQVLWLELMRRHGPKINRIRLAKGWLEHTNFPWDEYGVALANLARGIFPPASGHFGNFCTDCMGSPIRSEVWAAVAPGDPALACKLAYEDAMVDHSGEGIWGELFLAALQSAAFVTQDREELLQIGLDAIPTKCRVAKAIRSTVDWYGKTDDWLAIRRNILQHFGHENFTDAPQNLAFIILGWLAGKDFGESICVAVNCGQDTDCTGATLGALLGIIDPASIGQKWKKPISNRLVLSPQMKNINSAATIEELAELTVEMGTRMLKARSEKVRISDHERKPFQPKTKLKAGSLKLESPNTILLATEPLKISAVYPDGLTFVPGKKFRLGLCFRNESAGSVECNIRLSAPSQWPPVKCNLGDMKLSPGRTASRTIEMTVPRNVSIYKEHLLLHIRHKGISAEYSLPLISAWPWEIKAEGKKRTIWQPERVLLPLQFNRARWPKGRTFKTSTCFHLPRTQNLHLVLASNGSGRLMLDGKTIIDYRNAEFFPMPNRPEPGTFHDILLGPGWHKIEISMTFKCRDPSAALLIADTYSHMLVHDLTFSVLPCSAAGKKRTVS